MASRRPYWRLWGLALAALTLMILFLTVDAAGEWGFVLPFRGAKLAAMLLVAYATALATVMFQTIANSRILTPAMMGFDTLYSLIQTSVVAAFGAASLASAEPNMKFAVEVAIMTGFAVLLYRWLISAAFRSLHLLMLVGIILGVLFRSLAQLLQRMIDPNEFAVLQDRLFANFNTLHTEILALAGVAVLAVSIAAWRLLDTLDVLALGRENAINLGVDHRRVTTLILMLVAILVSVSTALVGPMTLFGLMVGNLAYLLAGAHRHRIVLPVAILVAVIALVGGQLLLERVFALNGALGMIIEFIGGLTFIALLMRGAMAR